MALLFSIAKVSIAIVQGVFGRIFFETTRWAIIVACPFSIKVKKSLLNHENADAKEFSARSNGALSTFLSTFFFRGGIAFSFSLFVGAPVNLAMTHTQYALATSRVGGRMYLVWLICQRYTKKTYR